VTLRRELRELLASRVSVFGRAFGYFWPTLCDIRQIYTDSQEYGMEPGDLLAYIRFGAGRRNLGRLLA
jgi:hypothetical protein